MQAHERESVLRVKALDDLAAAHGLYDHVLAFQQSVRLVNFHLLRLLTRPSSHVMKLTHVIITNIIVIVNVIATIITVTVIIITIVIVIVTVIVDVTGYQHSYNNHYNY